MNFKFRIWNGEKYLSLQEALNECIVGFKYNKDNSFELEPYYEDVVFEMSTGLTDKNGVDVYEGDVLHVGIYSYIEPLLGGNFEVVYSKTRASFVFKHLEGNVCYSSLDELTDINDFYTYELEIIGNIHEVPK